MGDSDGDEAVVLAFAHRCTGGQRHLLRSNAFPTAAGPASDFSRRLGHGRGFLDLPGVLWIAEAHALTQAGVMMSHGISEAPVDRASGSFSHRESVRPAIACTGCRGGKRQRPA